MIIMLILPYAICNVRFIINHFDFIIMYRTLITYVFSDNRAIQKYYCVTDRIMLDYTQ